MHSKKLVSRSDDFVVSVCFFRWDKLVPHIGQYSHCRLNPDCNVCGRLRNANSDLSG